VQVVQFQKEKVQNMNSRLIKKNEEQTELLKRVNELVDLNFK
jgi:hypothetical protein